MISTTQLIVKLKINNSNELLELLKWQIKIIIKKSDVFNRATFVTHHQSCTYLRKHG